MIVRELIEALQDCNQDKEITVFDEESIPYKIKYVAIDKHGNGEMSFIAIEQVEV